MATAHLTLQNAIKDLLNSNKSVSGLVANESVIKQAFLPVSTNLVLVGKGIILRKGIAEEATRVQLDVNVWTIVSQFDIAQSVAHAIRNALNDAVPWSLDGWHIPEMKQTIRLSHEQLAGESVAHALVAINALLIRSN